MRFSIGIPAYKATFLKECIDSIMAQTYRDFELIVVNDASPEDIDNILSAYASPQIRYYKNEVNTGAEHVVNNWNKCLSYAQGDYFVLMGDDDKMCPDYLEEFDKLINKYPFCGVYHCRSFIINERSLPIELTEPRPEFENVYDSVMQRIKGKRQFFISDYVYHTATLRNNGGYYKLPLAWASDDISSFIGAKENGVAHTNKPVFMYRRNAQTISNNGNPHAKLNAILGEETWLNDFVAKDPANETDLILRNGIRDEIKPFIQRRKVWTIYSAKPFSVWSIFKWMPLRKQYGFSTKELLYALILGYSEKVKGRSNS